jgi:lysyl-tRNA synthetase class 2
VFQDPDFAAEIAIKHGVSPKDVQQVKLGAMPQESELDRRVRAGHLGYLLFEAVAEAKLIQPTFLTEFPLAVSPLARKNDKDPAFCDRFELFVNGVELANGFSELNDPDDQRARFQAQVRAKTAGAEETMDYDEDYCRALEIGMPPAAGEGIGIDRLVMMLTGQPSIRDVLLFPLMRPE